MKRYLPLFAGLAMVAAVPASAQYGGGYSGSYGGGYGGGYGASRRAPDYDDDDYAPRRQYRREYGYGGRGGYGRVQIGRICVTARGSCGANPAPFGSSCGCPIPGFGFKRGAIGG